MGKIRPEQSSRGGNSSSEQEAAQRAEMTSREDTCAAPCTASSALAAADWPAAPARSVFDRLARGSAAARTSLCATSSLSYELQHRDASDAFRWCLVALVNADRVSAVAASNSELLQGGSCVQAPGEGANAGPTDLASCLLWP
ncbi:hypothetical protein PHYPSEUDO_013811 [Phytophthora pseudosyringae]|uniref:Uncharacterized protein n=1 Tax=Phytophthora pseudosyringae TaxID=221518 RepID=A0A8T1W6B8_9STRA|nr:hypothetical protein PHYPSEUDO_013811 [Phytophthora pseudosyringae]